MRDRVDPQSHAEMTALLSPADGLEPASKLYSSPPIESLEWLKELGDIARASFITETEAAPVANAEVTAQASTDLPTEAAPAVPAPASRIAAAPQSADAKLLEALLEYHRLRGPTLGARSGPKSANLFARVDSSTVATRESGFSSIEIPVVQDYQPKNSASPHRSSQPVHTVLKSKPLP